MTDFVALALLGGVLAVDAVTVGQFMVSRPLVAGTLTGLLLNDLETGLFVGAVLEVFLLVVVPSGGGRYPETGPAVVVGASAAVWTGGDAGVVLGVASALFLGYAFSLAQAGQRRLNRRWVPDLSTGRVGVAAVTTGHLMATALDFVRGVVVTGAALWVVRFGAPTLADAWPLGSGASRGLVSLGAFLSLGVVVRGLLRGRRWGWLLAGCVVGFSVARWIP